MNTDILPRRFTVMIERSPSGMWFVTSDVHPGYVCAITEQAGLEKGFSEIPHGLVEILTAQGEVDKAKSESAFAGKDSAPGTVQCDVCNGEGEYMRPLLDDRTMVRDCCWKCAGRGRIKREDAAAGGGVSEERSTG